MSENETPESSGAETTVRVLDEGPCRKRLQVEVPAEKVDEELESNYRQLRNTIQLPGFRKGKVPLSILKGRFGKKIEAEVQEEMVTRTFFDEIEKRELRVLGAPSFEKIAFAPGDPLTYEAAIEVTPEFEVPEYAGLEVDAQPVSVTAEDVDREVRSILEQHTTLEPVATGEQRVDDIAVCHLEMIGPAGESVFQRPEVYLKIGLDRVDNIEVARLGEKLAGAAADEVLEFAVEVPADFPIEGVRGGAATLRVRFHEAKRAVVPALDGALLERLGVESEEDLRGEIERNLAVRRKLLEESRQEDFLVEKLVAGVAMEFPPSILERRKEEVSMGRRFRLLREGRPQEEIDTALSGETSAIEEEARDELKRIFVLDRIADREGVLVTEDEVAKRLSAIALTTRRDPHEVLEEYRETGMLADLRAGMRREKARSVLRKKARVRQTGATPAPAAAEPEPAP
jgi:trigger factor